MDIIENFEYLHQIMVACIEKEMKKKGILSDVETFIPVYRNEGTVDEPCIWMTQHPTTAERQADISNTMELITPFEFDCVVYENDLEEGELASQNLATRVILAVTQNFLQCQKEIVGKRIIRRIGLETYYPVGEVQIQGKTERTPATGVVLNVVHIINWKICCEKYQKKYNGD